MLKFFKYFFKKRPEITSEEGNFRKMLFEAKQHRKLAQEILNVADLEKRKNFIYTLYTMISHVSPYSRTKAIARQRVIGMLQELLIQTIQAQVDEIRPMDDTEKNAVYTRILKPAREAALLNHDLEPTRRLELRARLSLIIAKLNHLSKPNTPMTPTRETTPDLPAELLH
ncbi:MAG: hypothetical protein U1E78_09395 [Gammaproteobacteria bacterium]